MFWRWRMGSAERRLDRLLPEKHRSKLGELTAPGLGSQLAALDTQVADRVIYLKLVGDLDGFLAEFRASAATASTREHQWVPRLPIKDVLIDPHKIAIRHRVPVREPASGGHHDTANTKGDMRPKP